jgi:hypothetical protein
VGVIVTPGRKFFLESLMFIERCLLRKIAFFVIILFLSCASRLLKHIHKLIDTFINLKICFNFVFLIKSVVGFFFHSRGIKRETEFLSS